MRMAKGWMRAGFAAALFALLLAPALAGAGSALAQDLLPATYYGGGLEEGVTVTAMIGDAACGTDEADSDGGWSIRVEAGGCDGAAVAGATVNFMIGDAMAEQSAEWSSGYLPDDTRDGITLTPAAMPEPEDGMDGDDSSMGDGMDGDDASMGDGDDSMTDGDGDGSMDGGMTPAAPDTGNAGLATASSGGAASWLALGFGLLALAATAGGRFATGRVR